MSAYNTELVTTWLSRLQPGKPLGGPARHDHLQDALAKLPHKQRAALVLRYYDDRSEAEIAEVLRVRPGTVKSLISRGLDDLRREVER